jgi:hypothetical protein
VVQLQGLPEGPLMINIILIFITPRTKHGIPLVLYKVVPHALRLERKVVLRVVKVSLRH